MKKVLLITLIVGVGYVGWKYWQSAKAEKELAWASATDPLD